MGIKEEPLGPILETCSTATTDIINQGRGPGLSLCCGFIRNHGGDIKVDSRLGGGRRFIILLPVYRQNTKDPRK